MSKVKSLITPAAQAELKPVEQPKGFMAALGKLAQPFSKPETPADPVERMRAKFAANVDAASKAITEGADKGKWFRKLPDGKFVLTFRNANSALTLNGAKQFQVADAESAGKLLEAAKTAANAGELDDALKATQRKPPVRKKKEPQPA
ncbi:hypothetical protein SOM08_14380 [Hydrogenophaga sp. SNF1]|uniref:hypothetical protein n=1 Tax=Hydrogenophaga sp. SNF1 TaxID=3098762 RepID=UPI002ACBDE4B|nr:hypothetical protein [Hydrogenophaga sp. SNF1]WQB82184.1 hypothetical protein SOM08_14380 [Hydrogenophaga sp. SNF1]